MESVVKKRAWVYTASVRGRFQTVHRWSGVLLQAILFLTPWIPIRGAPALLIDIPGRRLYALGATFSASERKRGWALARSRSLRGSW